MDSSTRRADLIPDCPQLRRWDEEHNPETMSNHDDEFWGDQAEWKPTKELPRSDAERSGPVDVVRRGWSRLLGSGADPLGRKETPLHRHLVSHRRQARPRTAEYYGI